MSCMDTDAIYFAGYFDGEGCIRINRRERGKYLEHSVFITVGQKEGATLDWVSETFGGRVYQIKRDNSYVWTATNRIAYKVLHRITPFLKYKKPQAVIALSFYDNLVQGSFVSAEEKDRRNGLAQQLVLEKKIFTKSHSVKKRVQRLNESDSKEHVTV